MHSFLSIVLPALLALLIVSLPVFARHAPTRRALQAFGDVMARWSRHPLFRPAVALTATGVLFLLNHHALAAMPLVLGSTLTEGQYAGEFILSEGNGTLSRDTVTVTVPAATKYSPGLVLGKVTGSGKYVARDEDAMTGEEDAAGILYGECDNEAGLGSVDFTAVIVNRDAEVRGPALDANGGTEATVLADLLALGIKVRGDLTNVAT